MEQELALRDSEAVAEGEGEGEAVVLPGAHEAVPPVVSEAAALAVALREAMGQGVGVRAWQGEALALRVAAAA